MYAQPGYEAFVATVVQVSLEGDNVFGDDGGASQLVTVSGGVIDGCAVALAVGDGTTTTPTSGQLGGDGAPRGTGGGPPH